MEWLWEIRDTHKGHRELRNSLEPRKRGDHEKDSAKDWGDKGNPPGQWRRSQPIRAEPGEAEVEHRLPTVVWVATELPQSGRDPRFAHLAPLPPSPKGRLLRVGDMLDEQACKENGHGGEVGEDRNDASHRRGVAVREQSTRLSFVASAEEQREGEEVQRDGHTPYPLHGPGKEKVAVLLVPLCRLEAKVGTRLLEAVVEEEAEANRPPEVAL